MGSRRRWVLITIGSAAALLAACSADDRSSASATSSVEFDDSTSPSSTEGLEPDDTPSPTSGDGFEHIAFDAPSSYEVSPDGRFVAGDVDDRFCLAALSDIAGGRFDEASSIVCADRAERSFSSARFSPDSRSVVFAPSLVNTVPAPITVLDVDGDVTVVAQPPEDPAGSTGVFITPYFVDDSTVAAGRVVDDRRSFELVTFEVDSDGGPVVDTVRAPEMDPPSGSYWIAGGSLLVSVGERGEAGPVWAFDPIEGVATELAPDSFSGESENDERTMWQLHDRVDDVALVFDTGVFIYGLDGNPWWLLSDDGERAALDPAPGGGVVWYAAISPDGSTVAALVVDRASGGAERSTRMFTSSTSDVLAGSAEWRGVDLPADLTPADDVTSRVVSWEDEDHLLLKADDGVYRFDLD